jgi:hypothetical protein
MLWECIFDPEHTYAERLEELAETRASAFGEFGTVDEKRDVLWLEWNQLITHSADVCLIVAFQE